MIFHGVEISIAGGGADEKDEKYCRVSFAMCTCVLSIWKMGSTALSPM